MSKYKLPKIVKFNKKLLNDVQIVFTALPNGEAQDLSKHLSKNHTLIDLAADFRLNKASDYLKWYKQKHRAPKLIKKSIYLLPEINRKEIKKYNIISCPGCYPTSILLPLIPLFKKNLIKFNIITKMERINYSLSTWIGTYLYLYTGNFHHLYYKDFYLVYIMGYLHL